MFKEANEEFLPIAKDIFEKHSEDLNLIVEPEKVIFLRTDSKKKAYAYCKRITDEYELLTDKKFFIVIVNKYFDLLKTDAMKRYVLLHEMKHLHITDNGQYKLIDHNLKEFRELLKNPEWNLLLVDDGKPIEETNEGDVKIGLDFDFNNKQLVKELKKKLKEEDKEESEEDNTDDNGSSQDDDSRPNLEKEIVETE